MPTIRLANLLGVPSCSLGDDTYIIREGVVFLTYSSNPAYQPAFIGYVHVSNKSRSIQYDCEGILSLFISLDLEQKTHKIHAIQSRRHIPSKSGIPDNEIISARYHPLTVIGIDEFCADLIEETIRMFGQTLDGKAG